MTEPLLNVEHLRIEFNTRRGILVAVDDISFQVHPGEVFGIVGESGAGKSLTGQAIIGLLEPPGRIGAGQVTLNGRRIDQLPYHQMRRIRGKKIGMIFQDPLTSLNPLFTIGRQLTETILTHSDMNMGEARRKAIELHGESCAVCGFNFGSTYGRRGDGYIEVHHTKPLHVVDGQHPVDLETDLVPVCANCHRMIHRSRNDVLSVEDLRALLETDAVEQELR